MNANAVRQPANTPAPAIASEPSAAESLGWQLRSALPPLRLHSVSLYDEEANVLWLSEGALGPDEHSVVLEAIDVLRGDTSLPCFESGLEDGRLGIFLPVRAPQGSLVGIAMILADIKSVGDGVVDRIVTPQVRTIMQKVAVLLRPASASGRTSTNKHVRLPADSSAIPAAAASVSPANSASPDETVPPVLSAREVQDILEFELAPDQPVSQTPRATEVSIPDVGDLTLEETSNVPVLNAPVLRPAESRKEGASHPGIPATAPTSTLPAAEGLQKPVAATGTAKVMSATGTARSIASTGMAAALAATDTSRSLSPGQTTTSRILELPEGVTLDLELQPFTRLRAGGRTRRFEIVTRTSHPNRVPPGIDRIALQRLLTWLGSNRAAWNSEPTSFTLNLSITSLEDERFPQFVASNLKTHGIAPENIGFEIAEPLCLQRRAQVERFVTLCDKLGCFVVIDDFSLDSSVVSMLRSKALRLVKIDPRLTSVALKDKLAQAMVVAIAQAVKVLGIHCAAKRVDSQASMQWLTAIGCDFAQGPIVSPLQPLHSLGSRPAPGAADAAKA